MGSTYEKTIDRESAHEKLKARAGGGETLPAGKGGTATPQAQRTVRRRLDGRHQRHPVRLDRPARRHVAKAWSMPWRRARRARSARRWRAKSRAACWAVCSVVRPARDAEPAIPRDGRWQVIDWSALERWPLAEAIRHSVWAYPVLETLHIAAFATLVGSLLVLELRVFGAQPALSLTALGRLAVRTALMAFRPRRAERVAAVYLGRDRNRRQSRVPGQTGVDPDGRGQCAGVSCAGFVATARWRRAPAGGPVACALVRRDRGRPADCVRLVSGRWPLNGASK